MTDRSGENGSETLLSDLSDEELVKKYADGRLNGSKAAPYITELIYRYFGFIKSRAGSFGAQAAKSGISLTGEDFVQEGLLGFINAVRSFDPERGSSFSAFAYSCVLNRMRTAAARMDKLETIENAEESRSESGSPESIIIGRELWDEAEGILSELEYSALRLHISGLSPREIGARLGVSEKSADNALVRARRKLREAFGHHR